MNKESIDKLIKLCKENKHVTLPVKKKVISVSCIMFYTSSIDSYCIQIHSVKRHKELKNFKLPFKEIINKDIETVLKIFNETTYCKLNNDFVTKTVYNNSKEFADIMCDLLTDELSYNSCCVCFDKTKCVTSCNHYVCVECLEQDIKKCPMCRFDFNSIKYDDEDDEDDEDE